jgi:osmotically inducible protein OsmC
MSSAAPHRFHVTATWDLAEKKGQVTNEESGLAVVHTGATALGGIGGATNPEELLAAAASSCFVQTWSIFIAKLRLPIEHPVVGAGCTVEPDPAGGFRVTRIDLHPRVSPALWEERRADVEKTLQLAEKYCIVSKAVKADGNVLKVTPELF